MIWATGRKLPNLFSFIIIFGCIFQTTNLYITGAIITYMVPPEAFGVWNFELILMHNLGWLVETMLLATSRNNKLWHCDISYLRKRWQLQIPTNLTQIKKYLLLITNTLFYILNVYKFDYMSYPKETVWSRKYMYTFVYMFCVNNLLIIP